MTAAIAEADAETVRTGDVEELANRYSEQFSLQAPDLIDGAISVNVEEAQVDVTGDFRFGAFGPESVHVAGIRASYYVPFQESGNFFIAPRAFGT